ncbi:hypothetical protein Tsubulata_028869 [Turnera subulata]|uniref:ATP-dependent RNA helicase n=1 Tax=Turnera subulata TaxID=218843 RepID=A0A9Q0FPA5_9ROSI|nr:hypothetical protein Tsubulata_028869 [Turnera subulata]
MYSPIFLRRCKPLPDLLRSRGLLTRLMGGGPRTFPGGINKWQWKRLHEKKAREKEKRLLEHEKQLYQARVRTQIRSKLAPQPDPKLSPESASSSTTPSPMSPTAHIKALADRFMKAGAEDLWNEDDGPVSKAANERPGPVNSRNRRPGSINSPVDLRGLISGGSNSIRAGENGWKYSKGRNFSVQAFQGRSDSVRPRQRKFRRNESSSGDDDDNEGDTDYGFFNDPEKSAKKREGLKKDSLNVRDYMGSKSNRGGLKYLSNVRDNEDDGDYGFFNDPKKKLEVSKDSRDGRDHMRSNRGFSDRKEKRFWRNDSDDDDDDEEEEGEGVSVKEVGSRAALGKYDVKVTKRVPLKDFEDGNDIERIRLELQKRKEELNETYEEESVLSEKRFDECGISPLTVKALTASGYVQMTRVQEATLSVCLEGKDALVKAKTGTGKSAAFLLPAIEAVLKAVSSNSRHRVPPVYVLILCPTRELASQIAAEANAMLKYHDGIGVQTLVGGTRFKDDQKRLESNPCQIIVATPGRLLDHIENRGGLSVHLMALKMLILDEADHLLHLGFRKDVEKIIDCLPRQRQSLLFSATIPKEVRRISQLVLKKDHMVVNTVGLGSVETPVKVKQSFLVIPHESHFQAVYHLLKEHISKAPDYKVIVFCTTGMVTSLMFLLLREMNMSVREMHSRKPQLHRTRVSDEFRESKRLVLVTSDVSARGMNYPDVTLVIQVGIPSDREQYIHRLGRTGREGKDGEGILMLAPWEEYFLDELKDLPLEKIPLPLMDQETKHKIDDSMSKIDSSMKEAAYHAWLGYYNSIREIGRDKTSLVELAKQFSESIGLQKPPPLFRKTALKMGLKDIPGIRIRR